VKATKGELLIEVHIKRAFRKKASFAHCGANEVSALRKTWFLRPQGKCTRHKASGAKPARMAQGAGARATEQERALRATLSIDFY
jgi:hypothetical protein